MPGRRCNECGRDLDELYSLLQDICLESGRNVPSERNFNHVRNACCRETLRNMFRSEEEEEEKEGLRDQERNAIPHRDSDEVEYESFEDPATPRQPGTGNMLGSPSRMSLGLEVA